MNNFDSNKKYFGRYLRYVNQIERLTEQYNELSVKVSSTHGVKLDGMPKGNKDRFLDDDIVELDELDHRIKLIKNESINFRRGITNALDHLDNPDCSAILEERFIHNKTMNVTAEDIYKSERQNKRLYSKVMNEHRFDKENNIP
ncbi:hypothetical protein [Companilactobacillus kimchii]|uniref:Uncharacterized protein n=2 Tax=Companilactobacillus kimchii TaxID=2801452 RepID=A0ABR5NR30_9LACO|nr:hypothetical protein [Companilactobacillus kimchii]GEO47865.1 hypothetical protein LKI01_18640 [Companilactobacillus paralimentarius]KAE9559102.1 hypothetical protein ATN91_12410 [Companilactobacillus kimchii]KAE9560884.1 hypothetical protein ATN91_08765 [Companilactobacillus kimchii]KRK50136.1 hypothetical protein FC97_GL001865 [Companilactobacillus kimchii DSM 13961 = JCM 10707]OWF32219.1 hypothetical protein LKACC12383_02244 [Companilactobacillus kimchii]